MEKKQKPLLKSQPKNLVGPEPAKPSPLPVTNLPNDSAIQTPVSTAVPPSPKITASQLLLPLAIIVAGMFIGVGLFFSNFYKVKYGTNDTAGASTETGINTQQLLDAAKKVAPVTATDHIRGRLDAKILMVEYSDLDCPYCKKVHSTLQQLTQDYKDTDLAWVYRHFPLTMIHPTAESKARASECVAAIGGEPGFWKFVDELFQGSSPNKTDDQLANIAKTLGVNKKDFSACLKGEQFADKVSAQNKNAVEAGGEGTPFFVFIKGDKFLPISGALPIEYFKNEIDTLLKS